MDWGQLTPEGSVTCPKCDGTGYFPQPESMCNDCPYEKQSCTTCIESGDHLLDNGTYCDLCGGCGQVTESDEKEWKYNRPINGHKH